jgi:hypothetical protein
MVMALKVRAVASSSGCRRRTGMRAGDMRCEDRGIVDSGGMRGRVFGQE